MVIAKNDGYASMLYDIILREVRHTVNISVDVDNVVDSQCRIGPMVEQVTTRLGTMNRVRTTSSNEYQIVTSCT